MNCSLPILVLCLLVASANAAEPRPTDGPILTAPPLADQVVLPSPVAGFAPVCGPGRLTCPSSGFGRTVLVGGAGTGLLVGSAVLGVAAGTLLPMWQFQAHGRPDPLVSTLGMGVGLGVGVAASQLLVPLAAPLGDDAGYAVSVSDVRMASWQSSRWAALAGGLGVATMAVGASMERREFGAGQGVMGVGATTVLLSGLVYFGLELAGVLEGSQRERRPRR